MQVKGTWLSIYVRIIRKFIKPDDPNDKRKVDPKKKSLFDPYLKPSDWELMDQFILPSQKYDYDCFQRIGTAVFKVVANGELETVRFFGRLFIKGLLETYRNMLVKNDPVASMKKFTEFHGMYFEEVDSKAVFIESTDNSAVLKFELTKEDKKYEGAAAMAYQIAGSFEQLVELAGGENVQLKFEEDDDKNFIYHISWT